MESSCAILLGTPPASWPDNTPCRVHHTISEPVSRHVEPVNQYFLAHARRLLHKRSFSEDERLEAEKKAAQIQQEQQQVDAAIDFEEEPRETRKLISLDPKDWKRHDLYAILGLGALRYRATPEQIKLAHKRKVLRHHPDKKAHTEGGIHDDSFFKCISKAYGILSDPAKRPLYDSIDFGLTDPQPPKMAKGDDFFTTFQPIFDFESRFSKAKDVPRLGDMNTTEDEVVRFYDFWFNFDSWRSFEYLNKDEDEGETRDDKRQIAKKNRAEQAKRKKEDTARLRIIVEKAQAADPRLKIFKEEKKKAKEQKKKEREEAAKAAEEQKKKDDEQFKLDQEKQEELKRQEATELKKQKERTKKLVRKERKAIKALIKERLQPTSDVVEEAQMADLELIFETMDLDAIEAWRKELETAGIAETREKITDKANQLVQRRLQKSSNFSHFEIKAEITPPDLENKSKYPVGTVNRWQVVADYVADHAGVAVRTEEELIQKVGELKKGTSGLADHEKDQLQHLKKHNDDKHLVEEPTINYDYNEPASTAKPAKPAKAARPVEVAEPKKKSTPLNKAQPVPTAAPTTAGPKMQVKLVKPQVAKPETKPTVTKTPVNVVAAQTAKPLTTSVPANAAKKSPPKPVEKPLTPVNTPSGSKPQPSPTIPEPKPAVIPVVPRPWNNEEQQALEHALQTYPPNWTGEGDRWDHIASLVQGRTKKECKLRVKAILQEMRAKKMNQ
ncbi:uncharacterized protein BYT42DRAFT_148760 [Radiomyces spectabilis]|uniref:uncharacterized protein n=1 Tax=Radiomyces spectabilis TaxID=64574 RepID=UPI00221F500F|nr:uncharacterized protein BYT42DRAFT_148760 [Radiomyces spectabilis]KAI8365973.1 hypothetical protein BYT42DRAFT_148760 [Radiomyces spectabilis]